MMGKVFWGALGATGLGLAIVFTLLLREKEANGVLKSDIQRVIDANKQEQAARIALADRAESILARVSIERGAAERASEALVQAEVARGTQVAALEARLRAATENLSDEEIVCALEPVPADLLASLHADPGHQRPRSGRPAGNVVPDDPAAPVEPLRD